MTTYLDSLPSTVEWPVRALGDGDWRGVSARTAEIHGSHPDRSDYTAKDR